MSRPRLIVPGAVELLPLSTGETHELLVGELAGYRLRTSITDWKNTYTFVALDDLSLDERCRFAPQLEEEWVAVNAAGATRGGYRDGGIRRARLVEILLHARLLLVGSTDRRDLGAAAHVDVTGPHRVLEVGFQRNADDFFHLHLARGGVAMASVSGALAFIEAQLGGGDGDPVLDADRMLDRVLRAATRGLADLDQIGLAFWIADATHLDAWDAHLATVVERAAPYEALSREIARLVRGAPEGADAIELPSYGEARRILLPARTLREAEGDEDLDVSVDVEGRRELSLPEEPVWTVSGVDPAPDPPPAPREIFFGPRPRRPRAPARTGGARLAWVLVALIVIGLLALARCARGGAHGPTGMRFGAPAATLRAPGG